MKTPCPYCEARKVDAWNRLPATGCIDCNKALIKVCVRNSEEEFIDTRMAWLKRWHPETHDSLVPWLAAYRAHHAQRVAA